MPGIYLIPSTFAFLTAFLLISQTAYSLKLGFPYGHKKVRGVNLGGWLVLEVGCHRIVPTPSTDYLSVEQPWITPRFATLRPVDDLRT